MRSGLEDSTREYCQEITAQMRDVVNFGINSKMIELDNVADSVSQVSDGSDTDALKEFLIRKASILEFDALILIDGSGTSLVQAVLEGVEPELQKIIELLSAQDFTLSDDCVVFFLKGRPCFIPRLSIWMMICHMYL